MSQQELQVCSLVLRPTALLMTQVDSKAMLLPNPVTPYTTKVGQITKIDAVLLADGVVMTRGYDAATSDATAYADD